jgi:hypothetical protein
MRAGGDGRDVAQVAVQERVMDLDSSSEEGDAREDTGDESFVLGAEGSDDEDVGDDGYRWWQSTEGNAVRWVVPQWKVLAADRGGWEGVDLKGLGANESGVGVC